MARSSQRAFRLATLISDKPDIPLQHLPVSGLEAAAFQAHSRATRAHARQFIHAARSSERSTSVYITQQGA